MPASLAHYIYVSTATHKIQVPELQDLLEVCRRNNRVLNVTGVLIYMGGRFFQIMEGHPTVLATLYEKILRDPRHKQITKIIDETIPGRAFPGPSMGFADLSFDDLSHIHVRNGHDETDSTLGDLPNPRSTRLIEAFCNGNWSLETPVEPKAGVTL